MIATLTLNMTTVVNAMPDVSSYGLSITSQAGCQHKHTAKTQLSSILNKTLGSIL